VTTLVPRNAGDVTDAVRWAVAEGASLEVLAGGTRRGLGRPVDALHVLDMSALKGVVAHEPEELILTALPATPLAEIEALLQSRNQCLAFEPPHLSTGNSTLGGAVATAFSGPRRPKSGSVRDHVLGMTAVSGRGELFTGGGKVVKNVTGYDLPKLLTGSFGTLAVYTEITVKVLPAPQDTRTLLIGGLDSGTAVRAMTAVLQSTADASGACHVPAGIDVPGKLLNEPVTALRLEGVTPSVEFRLARLWDQLGTQGPLAVLDHDASIAFWKAIRDVTPFAEDPSRMLWRISVPPARGAETLARIGRSLPGAKAFLDWGGGLMWLQLEAVTETAAAAEVAQKVRAALSEHNGHATLVRASEDVRRAVEVFHPQALAVAALSNRVKAQFDPKQVLNPGRMVAGV